MKIRKVQKLRDILLITGLVIMLCANIYVPLLIVGGVIVCSGLVTHFLYSKCPHCGEYLDRNAAKYCQHCGKELD